MPVDPSDIDNFFVDNVTPISAAVFNEWGGGVKAAWEASITAAADAEAAAGVATAPTDGQVAFLVDSPASDTRVALDVVYGGTVNVREHGAVGDGVANDTTACQAALDAGAGGQVFFPAGVYSVDPLYVPSSTRVFGAGGATVIFRRAATVANTESIGVVNVHGISGTPHVDVVLEAFAVDGNKAHITVDVGSGGDPFDVEGIALRYAERFRIAGVTVSNATAEGFDVDDSADGLLTDCWAIGCGGAGVHLSTGTARVRVVSCHAISCGGPLLRAGFDAYGGAADCSIIGCVTVSCYRGVTLGADGSVAVGCLDSSPTLQGFRATGARTTFSACRTTGDIEHAGTAGALVGCAATTITVTDPATTVMGCTPDSPPAATLTYATNWSAGGTVRIVRRGDFATGTWRFDKSTTAATEQETMATLPVGFRPIETIYAGGMVFNGSSAYVAGGAQIQTGGQIQVRLSGATGVTRVVGQATWRVAP
jgi:hypothetical protein